MRTILVANKCGNEKARFSRNPDISLANFGCNILHSVDFVDKRNW